MPAEFHWIHASNGHVPPNAVESGKTVEGEMLYVGRAFQNGIPCVGKVSSLFIYISMQFVETSTKQLQGTYFVSNLHKVLAVARYSLTINYQRMKLKIFTYVDV